MSSNVAQPARRRNGLQQACEPCRKRKLACDHAMPVCGRFLPAPPAPVPEILTPTPSTSVPRAEGDTGYLGATSFSIFLQETRSSLSQLQRHRPRGDDSLDLSSSSAAASSAAASPALLPGPRDTVAQSRTLEVAVRVLECIPDQALSRALILKSFNPIDGWVRDAVPHMADALWGTFGSVLGRGGGYEHYAGMAQALCANTARPLVEDHTDPHVWLASFSGSNLRWEALGVLFSYWSVGVASLPDDGVTPSTSDVPQIDRKESFHRFHECMGSCVELSGRTRGGNSLLLYLLLRYSTLTTVTHGDASLASWRIFSEAVSVATNLGLHVTPSSDNGFSITSQVRRRLFALTYGRDKSLAMFTGRPPLLSRRYCSTPLPLDLGNEALLAGDLSSSPALASLDAQGWNSENKLNTVTVLRARTSIAYIRDDILEMTLGIDQDLDLVRLSHLKHRQQKMYSAFPPVMLYSRADEIDMALDPWIMHARVVVYLEHLQNLFFLLRLLVKARQQQEDAVELLQTSFEMMSVSLVLWTRKETLSALRLDFDWIMVSYACPAAGVLCVELLMSDSTLHLGRSNIKRSELIQKLSVFIAFLGWMDLDRLAVANHRICGSVRQVVQGVLEHVLDHPEPPPAAGELPGPKPWNWNWNMEIPDDINVFSGFELLDTFDWLRAENGT